MVVETPVIGTRRPDCPQFSTPHVSEPQPNSLKGVTVPSDVVNCEGAELYAIELLSYSEKDNLLLKAETLKQIFE